MTHAVTDEAKAKNKQAWADAVNAALAGPQDDLSSQAVLIADDLMSNGPDFFQQFAELDPSILIGLLTSLLTTLLNRWLTCLKTPATDGPSPDQNQKLADFLNEHYDGTRYDRTIVNRGSHLVRQNLHQEKHRKLTHDEADIVAIRLFDRAREEPVTVVDAIIAKLSPA